MFLRAAVLLPLISWSLRLRGFRKTQAFLQKFLPRVGDYTNTHATDRSELTVRMVRAAVRHGLGHPTCLEESLALWWLLGRRRLATELRIGVRKQNDTFQAHAWVERDGIALNEPQALHEHYAAFDAALSSAPPGPR
jgi:hypothetical protein